LSSKNTSEISSSYTLGVFNVSVRHLLDDLGRRVSKTHSGKAKESAHQRMSILMQRFNAVFLHDSLLATDWRSYPIF